jgi:hypothetical protein
MKYTFVTGLHGNEQIPIIALAQMGVPQYIANHRALSAHKRYIDTDLNKSFKADGNGYEIERAKEILNDIDASATVIDLHTFSAQSDPFAIVVDEDMIDLAVQTGMPHVVIMEHNIKAGHALINHRKGVSVEVGKHDDHESFVVTQHLYKNLTGEQLLTHKPNIFRVIGIITEPGHYENFKETEQGFYPVLAGEKAYDFYGLKAVKETI